MALRIVLLSTKILIFFMLLVFQAKSTLFRIPAFGPNARIVSFQGDAFATNGAIQLTRNQRDANLTHSAGRVSYKRPVHIWDAKTGKLADFITHFRFAVKTAGSQPFGDGLSFFMAPINSHIPRRSDGGYLALFGPYSLFNASIVAVEFDSFSNSWDPAYDHVGININSIESVAVAPWNSRVEDGAAANAWVTYNSTAMKLSVYLSDEQNPIFGGNSILSYFVDLRKVLPEWVSVGFSAATGDLVELHNILSWEFSSSLRNY